MTFSTWASLKYLQEPATILGPQNRTEGSCVQLNMNNKSVNFDAGPMYRLVGKVGISVSSCYHPQMLANT